MICILLVISIIEEGGRPSLDLFWIKRYEGQVMQANIQILFKNLTENVGKFEEGVDRASTCSESNVMKGR
jgi:hypothetical protein